MHNSTKSLKKIATIIFNDDDIEEGWTNFTEQLKTIANSGGKKGNPQGQANMALHKIRRVLTGDNSVHVNRNFWHGCERYDRDVTGNIPLRAFRTLCLKFGFGLS